MTAQHINSLANLRPPVRKGQVLNPAGRKTCGAVLREAINSIVLRRWDVRKLRRLRNDVSRPVAWRAAAGRLIELVHFPDMADFQAVIEGKESLEEARARGVSTECVRKVKARTTLQKLPSGDTVTVTTVELELFDRAGEEFDRLCDRTEGKPKQTVNVRSDLPSSVMILTPMLSPDGALPELTGAPDPIPLLPAPPT